MKYVLSLLSLLLCTCSSTLEARLQKQPKRLNICWGCTLNPQQETQLTALVAVYNKAIRDYCHWTETAAKQKFVHVPPKVNQHYLHKYQAQIQQALTQLILFYQDLGISNAEINGLQKQLDQGQQKLCADLAILAFQRR